MYIASSMLNSLASEEQMKRRLLSNVSIVATEAARALTGPLAAEASASSSSASMPANASSHCEVHGNFDWSSLRGGFAGSHMTPAREGKRGGGTGAAASLAGTRSGSVRMVRLPTCAMAMRLIVAEAPQLSGVLAEQQRCLCWLGALREPHNDPRPHFLEVNNA